jgi:hypothetical protein
MDGMMEVWDFLFQHQAPIWPVKVADYPLHAIKVTGDLWLISDTYPYL